jgi:hypothetical protein
MSGLLILLVCLLFAAPASASDTAAAKDLKDLYYGEALYYAYQEDWFSAIARLDSELAQYRGLDEPELNSLYAHVGQAEFNVGDFELFYRMHQRAGRAIKAVIEGNVEETVRNHALFRLARMYFQKDRPQDALHALDRIKGSVPEKIRDELAFLKAQTLMADNRFDDAAGILKELQGAKGLEGFTTYNLGIALMKGGKAEEGRRYLDQGGRIKTDNPATLAIRDKANLALGDTLLREKNFEGAKEALDRVRLSGPLSNRALLGSGWADASRERYEHALVAWSILAEREVTDQAVQEAMLAVPYAYAKLGVYSQAALKYGRALEAFGREIEKLGASISSIREGKFLHALVREELKQDANWVVTLRRLPETPETFYLLELMASHDFQSSLQNYLDLEELRRKLEAWAGDLAAFEDLIEKRRAYYKPLLPAIDREFRRLDSQMRLRLEQRDRIEHRLKAMLSAPRPDYLATADERIIAEQVARLERALVAQSAAGPAGTLDRIRRLRGVLGWNIHTEYDRRLTEAHKNLAALNREIDLLSRQYKAFVRTRQAATQSYEGYDETIRSRRLRIRTAQEKTQALMARQGQLLELMAMNELTTRRGRLEELQVKARFALADSYDRAGKARLRKEAGQ